MNCILPSQNIDLLKTLLGKKITSVKRQIFKDDMDMEAYQQNADGPIEFRLDDNTMVHFISETETFSIGVVSGEMPRYGNSYLLVDVSDSPFWHDRIRQEISQIVYLKSSEWSEDYPSEFGVEIVFANGKKILIEYLDEENYPDMMRVADQYVGKPCIVQRV